MANPTGPSNVLKRKIARKLWKTKRRIWRDVSKFLMAPQKNRVECNLYRLQAATNDGDIVIVPGKVLGTGELSKKLTIACYAISGSAKTKIQSSGSTLLTIDELLESHPQGKGVKIII